LPRGCHSRIKIKKNLTARRSRHCAAKAAKTQKNKMCPDFRFIAFSVLANYLPQSFVV